MACNSAEIVSREMIKPSSPTPNHLRNHKLSFFDQMTPPMYITLIFFYKLKIPQESLKKSLSNSLTKFYPLAGRYSSERCIIDCNDLGALFVESKVEGDLMEFIKDPTVHDLQKLLPMKEAQNDVVLSVQINHFDCGGIAVATQMHHKAGDANSMVNFLNSWAAASRDCGDIDHPTFDMATLFPPKDFLKSDSSSVPPPVTEKTVAKRLVFDKKDLENLKLRASKVVKDPTRVEAISSFLLKHFRDASIARGSKKNLAVIHTVHLRPRMDPPLPNHAFGNAVSAAVATLPVLDHDDDDEDLVFVLRNAIRKIDGDFVKDLQNENGYLNFVRSFGALFLKEYPWYFTSWTRFPVYEVDHGWGKPVWVTTAPFRHQKNVVVLMSTSCGEGIEAWINMLEEDDAFIDFS